MAINIMFVDNATCVDEAVKWVLKDESCQLIVFKDPLEALRAIEEEEFAVVITDQILPRMTGMDFLRRVKERSPNTMGVMMTAFMEPKTAVKAIRCGYVCQFVKKPLDKEQVKRALSMAIASHKIEVINQRFPGKSSRRLPGKSPRNFGKPHPHPHLS